MTSGSLQNYYRDKIDDVDDNALDGRSFEGDANRPPVTTLKVEVTIPLKYLSNFWRSLDLPLINYKMELDLLWTKDCVLIQHHNNITGTNIMITSTKLYVPVVTMSINDKINFLENIKHGFKRTISLKQIQI